MKKFLLFACAAVFSLAASAQIAVNPKVQGKASQLKQTQKMSVNQEKMESSELSASTIQFVKKFGKKKAAAGADMLVGSYVEMRYYSYDDEPENSHFETAAANIKDTTVVIDGEPYDCLSLHIFDEFADVIGEYDPETKKVYIPAQLCYIDEEYGYGKMDLYGVGDDGYLSDDAITFSYDEEAGTLTLDQYGWAIYMSDYAKANPQDQNPFWDMALGREDALAPVNGFMEYTAKAVEDCDIYVEDLGEEVNVFNFWGTGCVNIIVNEDYSVSMPNSQVVGPMYLQNEADYETYGHFFHAYALNSEGKVSTDAEYAEGFLVNVDFQTGKLSLAKVGEPANGIYFNYLAKASLFDEDGSGYGSIMSGNIIVYPYGFSASMPSAIKNVTSKNAASNATFNLAGQRVSQNYKGVVVKGGKKMLMK